MATVMAQQEDTMAQQYQANMAQQGVAPTLIHPKFQRFVEFKKNDPPQFKDTTDLDSRVGEDLSSYGFPWRLKDDLCHVYASLRSWVLIARSTTDDGGPWRSYYLAQLQEAITGVKECRCPLSFDLCVSTPTATPVATSVVCANCPISASGRNYRVNLICLPLSELELHMILDCELRMKSRKVYIYLH